jgi:hypothetical protein
MGGNGFMETKKFILKRFDAPDERREFKGHGHMDLLSFDNGYAIGRGSFEPGWKWSEDVKPIEGTDSCTAAHSGFCLKGKLKVRMDSGEEFLVQAGDAFQIFPGHDAWVEGDESCELLDVTGYVEYALRKGESKVA